MVTMENFKQMALAFPDAIEYPHFDRTAFKVKKTFATLDIKNNRACLMLSVIDQSVFCAINKDIIYPVPNKWGKNGATYFELKTVAKSILKDALKRAFDKSLQKN
jgi:hypothetical protein